MAHAGGLPRRQVAQLRLRQPGTPALAGQAREEVVRRALELVQKPRRRRRVVETAGPFAVAPKRRHVAQREPRTEPLGRRVLQLVGLVEDHGVVLRQHPDRAVRGDAQAEVGEVQRVVDDDHVGVGGALARLLGKARGRERAACAQTALRADCDLGPGTGRGLVIELGAIAGQRRIEPGAQPLDGVAVQRIEQAHAELHDHAPAGVVGAALEQLRTDGPAARRGRERQIVAQQLRLQRQRGRGHDDATSRERRGHEIAEALPGAGARLADERPAPRQHVLDAPGHDELRRPLAVRGVRASERPACRKQPLEHVVSLRAGSPASRDDDQLARRRARRHAAMGLCDLAELVHGVDARVDCPAFDLLDDRRSNGPPTLASAASSD